MIQDRLQTSLYIDLPELQDMSLASFYQSLHQFTQRVKGSLDLQPDKQGCINHRKSVMTWIQEESIKLKQEKEKQKKSQHIFTGILAITGISTPNKKLINQEAALEKVKAIMVAKQTNFDPADIESLQLPTQIADSLKKLNKAKVPEYYGVVSGPLINSQYLRTREDFDNCLRRGCVNNLKFTSLGSDCNNVVKYQRILVEQLFNRLFNRQNELSMVIKIEVEKESFDKSIQIFCLVEDLLDKKARVRREVKEAKIQEETQQLYLNQGEEKIYIDEITIFNSFLTQMLMVPLQTIVSDYAIQIQGKKASLYKNHQSLSISDLSLYVKEHPSLRNPLFYFYAFIKGHEFKTSAIRQNMQFRQLFGNFYEILSIMVGFLKNDFSFRWGGGRMNSMAFSDEVFKVIWQVFHELIVLPTWIQQVITPIKPSITLYEVSGKVYPIFNEMLKIQKESYEQYQFALLSLPIQNYLTLNVNKITIEKYKDIFVNLNAVEYLNYNKCEPFQHVFAKTIKNYNLNNVDIYQSIYFLNFVAKHNPSILKEGVWVHPSWKSKQLWKEIAQIRNKQYDVLPYISINLEILALNLDFDPIQHSSHPFAAIKYDEQTDELFVRIETLMGILRSRYQKKCQEYLSFLIEKSFKYKKYKVVEFLIKKGVHINNYEQIFSPLFFSSTRDSKMQRHQQRNKLKQLMKDREPQMYRRYQWEELINVHLREHIDCQHQAILETIRRGRFYVERDMYGHLTSGSSMNNTISRKDYMFSANRLIAKLDIFGAAEAYIEVTEYPLLRYFYSFFLGRLGKGYLSLNFCGFFSEQGKLVHLVQCIPQCFNFQKGLASHTESELKNYTSPDDIAEAILISMILMPTNVLLRNIIISPLTAQTSEKGERKNLFIVDFHDFYQKNGFESRAGTTTLKVRNSLFLFDQMGNSFSQRLMKKYSSINVMQIVNGLFKECASFISEVNHIRPKEVNIPQDQQQLYTLIFQNGFSEALTERMFKVRNTFEKCLRSKTHLDPLELLEILNPPLSYYYREIIQTTPKLVERQRIMLDDGFKKSLIVNDRLINFLPNAYYVEEVRDTFPNHYRRFGFQGPTQNLTALDRNILKFSVYTQKITDLRQYGHQTIEYFIRNIDLSTYLREERDTLVSRMQEYSKDYLTNEKNCLPLSVVRINNIDSIKQKALRFSDERLRDLIFQQARCTQSEFNSLLRKYHSMRNLVLRNLLGVQRIGEFIISLSETLTLRSLKYLSIIGCPDIVNIDLRCQQLEHVTLRRNKALSEIYIYSKRFKNMDCSECSKLRLENIGIYILKRINVLICQNSCEGDVKRLQDKNYSIFLTRILRYLFNRFEQSNTYKLQLIITLIKLELIDEKLFGLKGSLSNKSLVTVVAKLGKEMHCLVQTQLFDLFLRNNLLDLLNIDEMLKIEVSSLKSIENYLGRLIKMKEEGQRPFKKQFSGLVFKQFIKIPQFYIQHINFIKFIVSYIDVDKTFKLHLSLSIDIAVSDYIQIINIINKKENLQKLEIIIENSYINNDLLIFLFTLDSDRNKISRLQFVNCDIKVERDMLLSGQGAIKSVAFSNCSITSIHFIVFFVNLVALEINNCKMTQQAHELFKAIGLLKHLISLSLIKLKHNFKEEQLNLQSLFTALQSLSKLQQFDFSSNQLDKGELIYFSSQISKIKIYQLTLFSFHIDSLDEYIDDFLYHQHIKIINIDFKRKNANLIQSFFNSLARNLSILRVNVKTDHEVDSHFFQKLKNNRVLQNFHSNQPIPNWLKNHIQNNPKVKSSIYEYESFEPSISSSGKKQDFYRIGLSLDGGGVRGLLLATQLDYLSRKVGKPLHKIFDCVGGTSIGGILALASTGSHDGSNPVCSTADLMDIFQLYGNRIFKKSQFGNIANLFQNKYDVKSFQQLLSGYFKQTKLSDVLTQTNVVITAVNRLTNEDVVFRSINAIFDRNQDFYMKDIARGTSAAPTYFPSAQIKNINATQRYSLIDGGVGLNNPSKLVIDDIIKITQNQAHKNNYFLLSLGTGRLINEAIPSKAGIKDLAPIIDSFTESANYFIEKDLAQNYRGHFLRVSPLINMHRKDGELDNTSPEILKVYRDTGLYSAQENFTNTIAYGKYKNQSLVEWLQENTDRKYQA